MRWMLLGFAVMMLAACEPDKMPATPPVSKAENAERERIGLRAIKPHCFLYRVQFNEEDWKIGPDRGLDKRIHRDPEGSIVWEQDYYYTRREFPSISGTNFEMFAVTYDYTDNLISIVATTDNKEVTSLIEGLQYSLYMGKAAETNQDTLEVAKQIMVILKLVPDDISMNDAINIEPK